MFRLLKVGDMAVRNFHGSLSFWQVIEVRHSTLVIGLGWVFCRNCGAELDEDLGWDCRTTGSYLENILQ